MLPKISGNAFGLDSGVKRAKAGINADKLGQASSALAKEEGKRESEARST